MHRGLHLGGDAQQVKRQEIKQSKRRTKGPHVHRNLHLGRDAQQVKQQEIEQENDKNSCKADDKQSSKQQAIKESKAITTRGAARAPRLAPRLGCAAGQTA